MIDCVHIIDLDSRRRARAAFELRQRGLHAEIYDGLAEFSEKPPREGVVFVADDSVARGPEEVAEVLQLFGTALPTVMYACAPPPERIVAAMLAGALDYLPWPFNAWSLDAAFRRLARDGERRVAQQRIRVVAQADVNKLSRRERQVLIQIVKGLSNKEIAAVLNISPRTVEIHRANMLDKLDARSTADAVRIGMYAGLDQDGVPFAA